MTNYYADNLSADRLRQCYELAPPRIQQYLQAEIDYSLSLVNSRSSVLELGCGYGRILQPLSEHAGELYGIDNSVENILFAKKYLQENKLIDLCVMDAIHLGFVDDCFDIVLCLQNGISAFHVNQKVLINEAVRVCKPGGVVVFSSYSDKIWESRLKWFQLQANTGLVGEIDYEKTKDGIIVCKDGFTATTITEEDFRKLIDALHLNAEIKETDQSTIMCSIFKE